jgi:capsular polysaccharide biosynthesis protein/cellulose biosynthesis protein BcsQ
VPQPQPAARRQLGFVKRQAGLVIIVTVAALGAAAATSFTQQKVYRASTKIVVGQGGGIFQPQFGNVFQPFTQTMSSLFKSEIVANTVIRDLDLNETSKSLLAHVHVATTPESAVLEVNFDSSNRADAVRTLRSMASIFTSLVRQKLGRTQGTAPQTGALPPITATVFDPAHASSTPVSPRPVRTLAFAGVIGLILGMVLGLLRDALDDRLRGRDEVEEHFAAPVVAVLPKSMLGRQAVASARKRALSLRREATQRQRRAQTEALDRLRWQLSRDGAAGKLVVITSSASGDGKSTVAANLGVALALAGHDVICVDADPTSPGLSNYLDLERAGGNASPLTSERGDLPEALRDVSIRDGVAERPSRPADAAGNEPAEPPLPDLGRSANRASGDGQPGRMQLLVWGHEQEARAHRPIRDLAAELKAQAGYVVVDTPPLPSGTTLALLSVADETIVVAREEKTTKEQARFVRQTLERLHIPSYSIVSIGTH